MYIQPIYLPSNSVREALHLWSDVLEVPDGLAGLVRVRVLQLRDNAGPHNLVGVRLHTEIEVKGTASRELDHSESSRYLNCSRLIYLYPQWIGKYGTVNS